MPGRERPRRGRMLRRCRRRYLDWYWKVNPPPTGIGLQLVTGDRARVRAHQRRARTSHSSVPSRPQIRVRAAARRSARRASCSAALQHEGGGPAGVVPQRCDSGVGGHERVELDAQRGLRAPRRGDVHTAQPRDSHATSPAAGATESANLQEHAGHHRDVAADVQGRARHVQQPHNGVLHLGRVLLQRRQQPARDGVELARERGQLATTRSAPHVLGSQRARCTRVARSPAAGGAAPSRCTAAARCRSAARMSWVARSRRAHRHVRGRRPLPRRRH